MIAKLHISVSQITNRVPDICLSHARANLMYIGALIGYRNRNEANTCREQQFYIPIRTEPVAG
ncbi:hypothetical protein BDB13_5156 [Rhodococcus sp. OK302]|nr:hypothetical protein BDB13_5156 [Rhodococcus sp. OK302]